MEELLYRVDKRDRVLGSIKRSRAHKEGALHRSGVVFLVRKNGRVLVQWRSAKKIFPNRFECSASFHVTFGETYKHAAERELREETGVSAKVRYLGRFSHFHYPENEMVGVFLARSDDRITLDKEEASGSKFLSVREMDRIAGSDMVTPWFGPAWRMARDKINKV